MLEWDIDYINLSVCIQTHTHTQTHSLVREKVPVYISQMKWFTSFYLIITALIDIFQQEKSS